VGLKLLLGARVRLAGEKIQLFLAIVTQLLFFIAYLMQIPEYCQP